MSQKAKVLLVFAGVFVAGAVAGGVVALRLEKERVLAIAAEKERVATEKIAADLSPVILKDLSGRLGLTPEQSKQVTPIIDRAAVRIAELSNDYREATQGYREATKELREDMQREVGVVLDSAQRKKLDQLQADQTKQYNLRFTRPPGPGPMGGGFDRGGRRGPPDSTSSNSGAQQFRPQRRPGGPPGPSGPPPGGRGNPTETPAAPAP